ncbi:MAG: DUF72 domain-containing protein [Anaerolineae bacterium]|jgi:uncharacterized protein YecE (DUF72 family)|nr:DUF72 domain-containing protein [Chloroflexota bacterium]
MARVLVGTCNWSDHKPFYPAGLPSNQQISYYAQRFSVVEVNSTYYRLMPARNFTLWAERTPPGFVFDVKAFQQLTFHDRKNAPQAETHAAFSASVQPLRDADKLGALHFQFPPWFVWTGQNLAYLRSLRDLYPDDLLSVEFRHSSWYGPQAFPEVGETLRGLRMGLTVVDAPQVGTGTAPMRLEVTTPTLCLVRFHGRNTGTWYARTRTTAERFDYLYAESELREWVPRIGQLAALVDVVHVLFNNNMQDYAVQNAVQLRMLLRQGQPEYEVVASPEEQGAGQQLPGFDSAASGR